MQQVLTDNGQLEMPRSTPSEPHIEFLITRDTFTAHDVRNLADRGEPAKAGIELPAMRQIERGLQAELVARRRARNVSATIDIEPAWVETQTQIRVCGRPAPRW